MLLIHWRACEEDRQEGSLAAKTMSATAPNVGTLTAVAAALAAFLASIGL